MQAQYRRNQNVYVNLAIIYGELGPQAVDPQRPETLKLAGVVLGTLHGWYRSIDGRWFAVCSYPVPWTSFHGTQELQLKDQLVPSGAVRVRDYTRQRGERTPLTRKWW